MAHIKRIDLTRDVAAHAEAYRKAIENVCKETAFSGGKYADAFDKEFAAYVGSRFASGVNNGTSALHLAMLALGVGPGDEVIVPANTYIATAWGVSYTGATPVFADCTPDTWEIDPSVLEDKITEKALSVFTSTVSLLTMRESARSQTVTDCLWWRIVPRLTEQSLRTEMWERWETWPASASTRARTSTHLVRAAVLPVRKKNIISISTV